MSDEIVDQPPPTPTEGVAIWELVIADMQERDRVGRERYGTPLQAFNGRDPLIDAYQEALDLVVYLRQAIEERKEPYLMGPDGIAHARPGLYRSGTPRYSPRADRVMVCDCIDSEPHVHRSDMEAR